jgi:sec-independent protein translocase protein TatA
MFGLGSQELLVILVIVMVLFGAKRLPQLARSLGSSLKEFKKGLDSTQAEDRSASAAPDRRSCAQCKTTLAPDWTHCPRCGQAVAQAPV